MSNEQVNQPTTPEQATESVVAPFESEFEGTGATGARPEAAQLASQPSPQPQHGQPVTREAAIQVTEAALAQFPTRQQLEAEFRFLQAQGDADDAALDRVRQTYQARVREEAALQFVKANPDFQPGEQNLIALAAHMQEFGLDPSNPLDIQRAWDELRRSNGQPTPQPQPQRPVSPGLRSSMSQPHPADPHGFVSRDDLEAKLDGMDLDSARQYMAELMRQKSGVPYPRSSSERAPGQPMRRR